MIFPLCAAHFELILFIVNFCYAILTLGYFFKGEGDDGDIESMEFPKCVVAGNK